METRANYVLIGAFAVLGFLGLLGFVLWFARVELDRQYAYFDVDFPTVAGLASASEVRFSGLPVGQVVEVRLAPDASGLVRVRLEVAADTPVRTGTVATIESQGLTGVAYVGLSAGDPDEPLLAAVSEQDVPVIASGRSVLQTLTEDAPTVVEELLAVARQIREILGEENQSRVGSILANLEASSGDIGQALDDFSAVTGTIATASEEIAAFSSRLDTISAAATQALETADTTLQQMTSLAKRAEQSLTYGDEALQSGRRALDSVDAFMTADVPRLINDLSETTARLRLQLDLVGRDAREMIGELRTTGGLATARLTEAEATLAATDAMLAQMTESLGTFDSASQSFEALVRGDGAALVADSRALVADARKVVASAAAVAETDLPAILEDVRAASATASRVIEQVGADLSSAAGRVDGLSRDATAALQTATDTFTRANETLTRLNGAIDTGDRALAAADSAFGSADRLIREEAATIAADLRATLDRMDGAIARVSDDLPEITANLRQTAEGARSAFAEIERAVGAASPTFQAFAREGLPQYTRLARETRTLVDNLDSLVRRVERDPARYFLGRDAPEFRR